MSGLTNVNVFAKAKEFYAENKTNLSKEQKENIGALETERIELSRILGIALKGIDKADAPAHEKNAARKQAIADAAAEEAKIIAKIHTIDPSRAVTVGEKAVKASMVAIDKANDVGTKVGSVAGFVAQPLNALRNSFSNGLKAQKVTEAVASKPEFSL